MNTTETTKETSNINSDPLTFELTTTDFFYVGFEDRFASRYFEVSTVNATSSVVTVEYWNGTSYTTVDDVIDQTLGFTQSGFISWVNKTDWEKTSQTGIDTDIELFWIRISVSVNLDGSTALQNVLNLFSNDDLVRAYYPYLIHDTRYLPIGRTNFLDQHVAAKDLIVLRLKQKRWILAEGDIIDINAVAVAAVHGFAWIVLNPIARDEETRELAKDALKQFGKELEQVNLNIDINADGVVSEQERINVSGFSRYSRQ